MAGLVSDIIAPHRLQSDSHLRIQCSGVLPPLKVHGAVRSRAITAYPLVSLKLRPPRTRCCDIHCNLGPRIITVVHDDIWLPAKISFSRTAEFRAVELQRFCQEQHWHWQLGVKSD